MSISFALKQRQSGSVFKWDLRITRSNEVLFPPMTKFRVKEDPLRCSSFA